MRLGSTTGCSFCPKPNEEQPASTAASRIAPYARHGAAYASCRARDPVIAISDLHMSSPRHRRRRPSPTCAQGAWRPCGARLCAGRPRWSAGGASVAGTYRPHEGSHRDAADIASRRGNEVRRAVAARSAVRVGEKARPHVGKVTRPVVVREIAIGRATDFGSGGGAGGQGDGGGGGGHHGGCCPFAVPVV